MRATEIMAGMTNASELLFAAYGLSDHSCSSRKPEWIGSQRDNNKQRFEGFRFQSPARRSPD
ncbi:MAG: hypothetical protein ACKPJJ_26080, partial [Planctomycetaceae bacterium]